MRKAVRDGRIPLDASGRIDPAAANAAWRANTDPGRPSSKLPGSDGAAAPPGVAAAAIAAAIASGEMELPEGMTLNDVRALREWEQALKTNVERRQLTDVLVDAKKVEDAAFRAARAARDQILALPERLAATLAATSDVAEVRRLLTEECRRTCEELASEMLKDPDAEDEPVPAHATAS